MSPAIAMNSPAVRLSAVLLLLVLSACAGMSSVGTAEAPPLSDARIAEILAAPDRSAADRTNDVRRKPERMLAFIGARPGMRALDLGTGGGYSAELLARAAGPAGKVYAQASPEDMARMKDAFARRAQGPGMQGVVLHVDAYEKPVPPEIAPGSLDLVTIFFAYHDQAGPGTDRARMNRAVFAALKPGGHYVIADHSGRAGTGNSEWNTLHRIEEAFVRREVEAAGFRLEAAGDFLRNPADPRDRMVFKPSQPNDEFVLKFVKPAVR
jgi:predicted methyltransferase